MQTDFYAHPVLNPKLPLNKIKLSSIYDLQYNENISAAAFFFTAGKNAKSGLKTPVVKQANSQVVTITCC